jgi:hypothetical protein
MENSFFNSKEDLIIFLKSILLKIENIENFMKISPPKHIPAYQKILGIQQKFDILNKNQKGYFFPQMVIARGVITLFMNGKYEDALRQLTSLKKDLIHMVKKIE